VLKSGKIPSVIVGAWFIKPKSKGGWGWSDSAWCKEVPPCRKNF